MSAYWGRGNCPMPVENEDAFLARLERQRGRIGRADRNRLAAMMAVEAERRGDVEAAARLRLRSGLDSD